MKNIDWQFIENNLLFIYQEMLTQGEVNNSSSVRELTKEEIAFGITRIPTWQESMEQLFEYIDVAGEYELAYEAIIWDLENLTYHLSGKASIKLLELGLIFKYKSELEEDNIFDFRQK